jgi:hypothetical protein
MLSLCCLLLTSCTPAYRNVRTFPVNHPACRALIVIEQGFNSILCVVDRDHNLRVVRAEMDVLGIIDQLSLSGSQEKVLILSVGEGHQFLSVYSVKDIAGHYDAPAGAIRALRTLDPYPNDLTEVRWVSDDCIQFSSRSDFSVFDKVYRRGRSDEPGQGPRKTWRWRLEADSFEEVALGGVLGCVGPVSNRTSS